MSIDPETARMTGEITKLLNSGSIRTFLEFIGNYSESVP